MAGISPATVGVPKKFFPHSNDFKANQRQKTKTANSPDTRCLPEKSVPQPDTIPVLNGFHEPLPYQTGGVLPPWCVCALLTLENWEGLKSPSRWRKPSVGIAWIHLSNPRNCLRTRVRFFMLQATRASCLAALLSLPSQQSTTNTSLENSGFKQFPMQFYFLLFHLFLKILKHQALQV